MSVLLLKLALAPALIGAVSLAGRRWGPAVSGWLVGLPLTSGPVALLLALDQSPSFAARASGGILAGGISIAVFCLTYSWLAVHRDWRVALVGSWLAFLGCTAALQEVSQEVSVPLVPLFAAVVAAQALALALLPRAVAPAHAAATAHAASAWWDIPARMLVATVFVYLLTEFAPALGPQLSGLLAPFPIYTAILAVFTHRLEGPAAAAHLMRGVVLGLFAFSVFFLLVALLLEPGGAALAFVVASLVALGIQGATLWLLRRSQRQPRMRETAATGSVTAVE
jgi:hypothetical protein